MVTTAGQGRNGGGTERGAGEGSRRRARLRGGQRARAGRGTGRGAGRLRPGGAAAAPTPRGSTYRAASPATSGRGPVRAVRTGVPHAIASSTGRPNPSQREGKGKRAALAY